MMNVIFKYDLYYENLKDFSIAEIEKMAKKTLIYYPELLGTKGLFYFYPLSDLKKNRIASTIPLNCPSSILADEFPDLDDLCRKNPNIDFAFQFWEPFLLGNEIKKTIDMSHEFQHAAQFRNNKKTYLHGSIVRRILSKHIPEEESPLEYEAIRKSKIVSTAIFGPARISEEINKLRSSSNIVKGFIEIFASIDTNQAYALEKEVSTLWGLHHIEKIIGELKNKPNRTYEENKIIEMYDYAGQ